MVNGKKKREKKKSARHQWSLSIMVKFCDEKDSEKGKEANEVRRRSVKEERVNGVGRLDEMESICLSKVYCIRKTGKEAIMKQSTGNTHRDGCWRSKRRIIRGMR